MSDGDEKREIDALRARYEEAVAAMSMAEARLHAAASGHTGALALYKSATDDMGRAHNDYREALRERALKENGAR